MAKDTSIRVKLTDEIVNALDFNFPPIGVDEAGRLIFATKPLEVPEVNKPRDWYLRDSLTPGFMVRVYPNKKAFMVQRKMTTRVDSIDALSSAPIKRQFGVVGVIKVAEARKIAQGMLGLMARGIDPHRELRDENRKRIEAKTKEGLTFGVFYNAWADAESGVKQTTMDDRKKVKKWMAGSPLWTVPIHQLKFEDVDQSIKPIFDLAIGKGEKLTYGPKKDGLATAWKIFRYTSSAYNTWVSDQGLEFARGTSYWGRLRKKYLWPEPNVRETILNTESRDDIEWLKSLVAMTHSDQHTLTVFAQYLLISLIWGGRKRETQKLRWEDLDFEKGIGTFIAENTKSKKAHYFPITPWVIEILEDRKKKNAEWGRDSEWVFPSREHGKPIANHRRALKELKADTGVWLNAHDLRRTVATETAQLTGTDSMLVSLTMAHSGKSFATTQKYIQTRTKLLRPIFEQRERQLRGFAGLEPLAEESDAIDALIEFLTEAKSDPLERGILMKKAEAMLLMLK